MTNRGGGSKQHGGHEINQRRSKSFLGKRRNKANLRARRAALREKGLNC